MQTLSDILTRDVKSCIAEDNIYEAAVKMKSWDIGAIPVVSNGQLIGIVTDRDLVIRAMAEKRPNSTQITEIMSHELITATPDMSVDEAAQLMSQNQIRRLPIVEGSKLVGMCALKDLAVRKSYDEEAEEALSHISEDKAGHQHPTAH
ncbi:CBS domain-containing protein [Bacillus horti]|uniref:CBS domain-containing protein n=1 Tax=Caldalkalibacillus horti TaxID=77523 RepID=A0ABT9W3N3_9BACI|nr:CBS domain-containing protein [Bacillus horti]MDQ0167857.1 CBS domain-containing protein [Bacillus horti]